jgi:hypothetical protein
MRNQNKSMKAEELLFMKGHEDRIDMINSLFARVSADAEKYKKLKKKEASLNGSLV